MTVSFEENEHTNWNAYIVHLIEFRKRVIRCGIAFSLVFSGLFLVDEKLYTFIAKPLLMQLPAGGQMIATEVTATFMVPMKLALAMAFIMLIPYFLHQLWSFIAPGLFKHEKRTVFPLLMFSILLFYAGLLFAYYLICPLALGFFANSAPTGVVL
jgi:sec-independent protein translocase protein TatC